MKISERQVRRFWATVDVLGPDDCWEWTGERKSDGYGRMKFGSTENGTRRRIAAHRIACELTHGPAPQEGLDVAHSCHNAGCCNPKHLRWATRLENMDDAVKAKRQWSKLTEAEVAQIRREYLMGSVTYAELATAFSVSATAIGCIVRRQLWKHLS